MFSLKLLWLQLHVLFEYPVIHRGQFGTLSLSRMSMHMHYARFGVKPASALHKIDMHHELMKFIATVITTLISPMKAAGTRTALLVDRARKASYSLTGRYLTLG